MRTYVLDAHAVLAFLENKPGADVVEDLLWKAVQAQQPVWLPVISWSEILCRVSKSTGEQAASEIRSRLEQLPIKLIEIDAPTALAAAGLCSAHSLPLTECFALALAKQRKATLVTTNAELADKQSGVKVQIAA